MQAGVRPKGVTLVNGVGLAPHPPLPASPATWGEAPLCPPLSVPRQTVHLGCRFSNGPGSCGAAAAKGGPRPSALTSTGTLPSPAARGMIPRERVPVAKGGRKPRSAAWTPRLSAGPEGRQDPSVGCLPSACEQQGQGAGAVEAAGGEVWAGRSGGKEAGGAVNQAILLSA